ncbi:MAG: hypothetical protein AB1486_22385 [Planctomycetota bacterium]
MAEKTEIKAVEMVRRIRDQQAEDLRGKSDAEIIAYFQRSAKVSRKRTCRQASPANKRMQPPARKARRG